MAFWIKSDDNSLVKSLRDLLNNINSVSEFSVEKLDTSSEFSISDLLFVNNSSLVNFDTNILEKVHFVILKPLFDVIDPKLLYHPHCLGVLDLDGHPREKLWARSILRYMELVCESCDVRNIAIELDTLTSQTELELSRIKLIHERLVPLRKGSFKGVNITSKYGAGEDNSSEFFDYIEKDNLLINYHFRAPSYAITSIILGLTSNLLTQKKLNEDNLKKYVKEVSSVIKEMKHDEHSTLELTLIIINLATKEVTGLNFGGNQLLNISGESLIEKNKYPVDQEFINKASFHFSLDRGNSYLFISSGLERCWKNNQSIQKFVKTRLAELESYDILNELFYEIKIKDQDFLINDAMASIFQVDKNAFFQV